MAEFVALHLPPSFHSNNNSYGFSYRDSGFGNSQIVFPPNRTRLLNRNRLLPRAALASEASSSLSVSTPSSSSASKQQTLQSLESSDTNTSPSSTDWKSKSSSQLARWARARRVRSGKLAAPPESRPNLASAISAPSSPRKETVPFDFQFGYADNPSPPIVQRENTIYMVSDGTGWTAEYSVNAALGQFEHCLTDQGCPVNTHIFSEINDVERLMEIIRDAGKENAILVYTLADPGLAEAAKKACQLHNIPHLDILGPITELLGTHMGVTPLGLPRGAPGRKSRLSKEYFKRIEAVEFTIKQDDGALPQNLYKADLVLVGVSRTSKTPLSTYMAQKGYKVANVPLVLGIDPPKELFEIDQNKIYALTINPNFLHAIRVARYKNLGVSSSSFYSNMDHIKKELEYSSKLFIDNPKWPVIEVTGKAIEETAAVILRIYHDREKKYIMPRISRRY